MKVKINIEWRKKEEPELDPEFLVRTALKAAGWTVGHIAVQGVWDEDKPAMPQGPWDETRLPHEMVAFTGARWAASSQAASLQALKLDKASGIL